MTSGTFALAGFRVFGNAGGKAPSVVQNLSVERKEGDRAVAAFNWTPVPGATGYNIRYGVAKDKLYQTYQVLGADSVTIGSLNGLQKYYFTIDAFNESGVRKGTSIIEAD